MQHTIQSHIYARQMKIYIPTKPRAAMFTAATNQQQPRRGGALIHQASGCGTSYHGARFQDENEH